eukprot:tig00021428_g21166.t1
MEARRARAAAATRLRPLVRDARSQIAVVESSASAAAVLRALLPLAGVQPGSSSPVEGPVATLAEDVRRAVGELGREAASEAFFECIFPSFAAFLLKDFSAAWLPSLPESERALCFDSFFNLAPASAAFAALAEGVREAPEDSAALSAVVRLLEPFADGAAWRRPRLCDLCAEQTSIDARDAARRAPRLLRPEQSDLAQLVISLPDRLSNRLRGPRPAPSSRGRTPPRCWTPASRSSPASSRGASAGPATPGRCGWRRGGKSGWASSSAGSPTPPSPRPPRPRRLRPPDGEGALAAVLRPVLEASPAARHAASSACLRAPAMPLPALARLVRPAPPAPAAPPRESDGAAGTPALLAAAVGTLAGLWGDPEFARAAPPPTRSARLESPDGAPASRPWRAAPAPPRPCPAPARELRAGPASPAAIGAGEEEDGLRAYDLAEPPTRAERRRAPQYVGDLLRGLQATRPEEWDALEAALLAAEGLLRAPAPPPRLPETAPALARALIHAPTSTGRAARRRACASWWPSWRAAPRRPSRSSPRSSTRRPSRRAPASRSSTASPPPPRSSPPPPPFPPPRPGPLRLRRRPAGWGGASPAELVAQRLEAKTRRFGRGPTRPAPSPHRNRFSPLLPLFFYSILSDYDRARAHVRLLGEDHVLLARLLHALGTFLELAAPSCPLQAPRPPPPAPPRPRLPVTGVQDGAGAGAAVLQLAWALRLHGEAPEWLVEAAEGDPDPLARALAAAALRAMLHLLEAGGYAPSDPRALP